jgi:dolichol-phosphate mannosyltransferase
MADPDVEDADVCALVPTLDEAESVGSVIEGLHGQGIDNVLVVDGQSTDGTRRIAREAGARVMVQSGSGKGQAIREAIEGLDAEYVLMLDGDGTYRPEDAPAMLEPLLRGDAEHVIGNRFADMEQGAMPRLNRLGNRLLNWTFTRLHGRNFADILSGYRAFSRESAERVTMTSEGFGIETELAAECARRDIPTTVVPITYCARPDESEPNLRPFRDGGVILMTMYARTKTSNPLFYFGSVGSLLSILGVGVAIYVGVEWVTRRISHEVLAFLAAFLVLVGVQLLIFGVLSDLIVTLHREQMRRLE